VVFHGSLFFGKGVDRLEMEWDRRRRRRSSTPTQPFPSLRTRSRNLPVDELGSPLICPLHRLLLRPPHRGSLPHSSFLSIIIQLYTLLRLSNPLSLSLEPKLQRRRRSSLLDGVANPPSSSSATSLG